ncbi:ABC transporter ATP-binding protein [Sulfitobacter sp. JB4-11]|uniref:ABC transporter ATP-binding protein n=1 Tax=Sulfitobacter rhodophyticola TaxID=3238304 RepID=UPI003512D035
MTVILELENVVKRFGGLTATNKMSFTIDKGESVGLIGPNGAGKTTIFSLIMGEHKVNEGSIRLHGEELTRLKTHKRIRRGIARTYQVPRPFADMDVLANIEVGLMPDSIFAMLTSPANHAEGRAIARSIGISDTDLHKSPSELSMGDLRKLELARTLATKPEVMLLDEVFAGLTAGEIEQISGLLAEKRQEGMTYIIVSHDLRSLEPLIDRAIAMTQGTFVCQGTYHEVMENEAVRMAYLGH